MLLPEAETDDQVRSADPDVRRLAPQAGRRGRRLRPDRPRGPHGAAGRAGPARREPHRRDRPTRRRWPFTSPRTPSPRTWRPARRGCSWASGSNAPSATTIPFAQWKRDQFWGLAAFFAGVGRSRARTTGRPDPRGRRPPRAGDPGHDEGRQGGVPRRPRSRSGRRRTTGARAAGRLGHGTREPVLRPRGGQPRLGPVLRHRAGRAGRRHGRGEPAVPPRAARRAGRPVPVARLRPEVPDPRPDGDAGLRPDQRGRPVGAGPPDLFAAMPVRGLSPGQLFESLAQATGFARGPAAACRPRGRSRASQFLELFANRDEKPTEGADVDPPGPGADERPLDVRRDQPREQRRRWPPWPRRPSSTRPGGSRRCSWPRSTRRPRPEELALLVPYVERGGPAATRRRRWPTSSGRC